MKRIAALTFLLATLTGCSLATEVFLENRTGQALEDIVLSGNGFTEQVGNLGPGKKIDLYVSPSGESGMGVAFTINGKRIDLPQSGYFEGGGQYIVSAIVNPDLSATVSASLR